MGIKPTDIFIVGLGKGGTKLLKVFPYFRELNIVGVSDINENAPGVKLAKKLKIPVFKSLDEVNKRITPDVALNVTGEDKVENLLREKFPDSEVLSGDTSKLIFSLTEDSLINYKLYEALYSASVALLSKEKQHEILSTIISEATKVLDAPAGSIALYDVANQTFYLATSVGLSKNVLSIQKWKPREDGLTNRILKSSEQPFVVEDFKKTDINLTKAIKKEGIRSLVAVKLQVEDELLGILYIDDFKPRKFSEHDKKSIRLLSQIAGLALDKFRLIEQTRMLAITDGLTSLYNHRHFHERLRQEVSRSRRANSSLSLIIFDVDFFKKYNDANGHLIGDEALRKIAKIIKENIRTSDVSARYGGEELAVILPEASKEFARKVAERIKKKVENTYFEGENLLPERVLTISAGISTFPEDAEQKDTLIKKADDALYIAKQTGRNKVVCRGDPG